MKSTKEYYVTQLDQYLIPGEADSGELRGSREVSSPAQESWVSRDTFIEPRRSVGSYKSNSTAVYVFGDGFEVTRLAQNHTACASNRKSYVLWFNHAPCVTATSPHRLRAPSSP